MLGLLFAIVTLCLGAPLIAEPDPHAAQKVHPTICEHLLSSDDPVAVWILFVDKGPGDQEEALRRLESSYDRRAVERRRLRRTAAGLFDVRDLPVHPHYIERVIETGVEIRVTSRWVNGVSAVASAEQVDSISRLACVRTIEPVLPIRTRPVPLSTDIGAPAIPSFYGFSEPQLAQIHLIELHNAGYTGEDVIIGVLDTGFRRTHEAFNHPEKPLDVVAEWDFVNDDPNTAPESGDPQSQHRHGTLILGTLAAYAPNALVGGAFDASFILAKVEDVTVEEQWEEDLFVAGLEFIEANGGDVATSSVVIFDVYPQEQLDGMTSVMTIGFNTATENGIHCFQGAGNEGHDDDPETSHLVPPADAFMVNTIGAVTSSGEITSFSSDGPTADDRVKPEFLTRGQDTYTVDPDNDADITTASGTSLATPLAAAVGACLVQARPEWSVEQVREVLIQTSDYYLENGTHDPLFVRGYGILDAFAASQQNPTSSVSLPRLATSIELAGPHPNPLSGNSTVPSFSVSLGYSVPERTAVQVAIFDVLGRKRATLLEGTLPKGLHTLAWDGCTSRGDRLPPGVYFVRLRAGRETRTARLVIAD